MDLLIKAICHLKMKKRVHQKIEAPKVDASLSKEVTELEKPNSIDKNKLNSERIEKKVNEENEEKKVQLKNAMSTISDFLNIPIRSVNFSDHEGSNKTVIKIFDKENQDVIMQFPSEEVLSIAQHIAELQQEVSAKAGIFIDKNIEPGILLDKSI